MIEKSHKRLIRDLLNAVVTHVGKEKKATVADFVRLVQLDLELQEQKSNMRELHVKWIKPTEISDNEI